MRVPRHVSHCLTSFLHSSVICVKAHLFRTHSDAALRVYTTHAQVWTRFFFHKSSSHCVRNICAESVIPPASYVASCCTKRFATDKNSVRLALLCTQSLIVLFIAVRIYRKWSRHFADINVFSYIKYYY